MNKNIIVFDIDGVLCWHPAYTARYDYDNKSEINKLSALHPECPIINFKSQYFTNIHIFVPYLDVLIKYLINQGSRIVFFSAGHHNRNHYVIKRLLTQLLGEEEYIALVAQGQFDIFSFNDMREMTYEDEHWDENTLGFVKDLTVILNKSEYLADTILVEDRPEMVAYNQAPCLVTLPLSDIFSMEIQESFSKNATYYLLGMFISYFEQKRHAEQPIFKLRAWLRKFLEIHANPSHYWLDCYVPFKYDDLVKNMIDLGLKEVQKNYPEAVFYQLDSLTSSHAVKLISSPLKPKSPLAG